MRPGFLLGLLAVGALTVLALLFAWSRPVVSPKANSGHLVSADEIQRLQPQAQTDSTLTAQQTQSLEQASQTNRLDPAVLEEQREAEIATRIAELRNLSRKTDPGSLQKLLAEVRSP